MLLAIDTSSLVLSCALAEKDRLVAEWTVQKRLTHSEQLIPHLDAMMKEAGVSKEDITAIAVSIGPGSFTGLRIGLATAKMASYIWKVPIVGVDTLESLARNMEGAEACRSRMPSGAMSMRHFTGLLTNSGRKHRKRRRPLTMSLRRPFVMAGLSSRSVNVPIRIRKSSNPPVSAWQRRTAALPEPAVSQEQPGQDWKRAKRMIRSPFFRITFAAVRQRSYGKNCTVNPDPRSRGKGCVCHL